MNTLKIKNSLIKKRTLLIGIIIGVTIAGSLTYAGNQGLIGSAFECLATGCSQLVIKDDAFKTGSIGADALTDGTITTAKLASDIKINTSSLTGTVTSSQIESIDASKVTSGTFTGARLASDVITTDKIADGSIGIVDIADSSVNSAKITDGSVANIDIASGISAGKLIGDIPPTVTYGGKALSSLGGGATVSAEYPYSYSYYTTVSSDCPSGRTYSSTKSYAIQRLYNVVNYGGVGTSCGTSNPNSSTLRSTTLTGIATTCSTTTTGTSPYIYTFYSKTVYTATSTYKSDLVNICYKSV